MLFRTNSASGVPIYIQLMEQIKHAIETGALAPGDQLPGIRKVAEELVINPNTVAKVYRELEHEGVVELRQGAGAFIAARAGGSGRALNARTDRLRVATPAVKNMVARLDALGLTEEEMRRLFEAELTRLREGLVELPSERKRR